MTTEPVNPGAQNEGDSAEVTVIVPFDVADYQRLVRACQTVSDARGQPYTTHDLICDAVTLAVQDIEGGGSKDDAPPADGGAP